jgi:hypothetical protein
VRTGGLRGPPEARPLRVRRRRHRAHPHEHEERERVRGDVEAVRGRQPDRGDEASGERGTGEGAEGAAERHERARGGHLVPLDEARLERVERRPLHPVERRVQRRHGEQHPQLRVGQEAVREQDPRRGHHPELAEEHHAPPVDRIGEGSAEEREDENRDELGEPDQADDE